MSEQEEHGEEPGCERCADLAARIEELQDSLARTQADYQNFRRRTEEDAHTRQKRAAAKVISDILGVLDSLELALRQTEERSDFYVGVELIYGQLISVLEEHGVERIPTDAFDPALHEAVLREPSDEPKGTIIETLQPGYRLGGQTLRTAKVKVSAGQEDNT